VKRSLLTSERLLSAQTETTIMTVS